MNISAARRRETLRRVDDIEARVTGWPGRPEVWGLNTSPCDWHRRTNGTRSSAARGSFTGTSHQCLRFSEPVEGGTPARSLHRRGRPIWHKTKSEVSEDSTVTAARFGARTVWPAKYRLGHVQMSKSRAEETEVSKHRSNREFEDNEYDKEGFKNQGRI